MNKELNYAKGKAGEKTAEAYLKKRGYKIIERNIKSPFGEIDLVADDHGTLVFVEVKSRRNNHFGLPEESVGIQKKHKLYRLALWYLARYKKTPQTRFDVLAIEGDTLDYNIRLIQNAIEF